MQAILTFISSLRLGALFHIPQALAQVSVTNFGTGNLSNLLVASTKNIYETVSGIINIILSFLGALTILIILYGAFIWLTSQGNKEKVQRAKMIIVSAVIGLLIIFSAYALSTFIIQRLGGATGVTTEEPGYIPPTDPNQPGCDAPTNPNQVKICRVRPMSAGLGSAVTIQGYHFGTTQGTVTFTNGAHTAVAQIVSCSGGVDWHDQQITAIVPTSLVPDNNYKIIVHNATAGTVDGSFPDIGGFTITNSATPSIYCLNPNHGIIGTSIRVEGKYFGATPTNNDEVYIDFANSSQYRILRATTADISSWADDVIVFNVPNDALSGDVTVRLNVNTTATISNPKFFQVDCSANSNNSSECPTSHCCAALQCRPASICQAGNQAANMPTIISITPNNGAERNLITIQGRNFGSTRGQVTFYSATQSAAGLLPSTLNAACSNTDTWSDTSIIVGVPLNVNMSNGTLDVEVTTAAPTSLVSTPATFLKNDINRPGICFADKSTGSFQTPVTIKGTNFTNNAGDKVTYGGIDGYDIVIHPNPANDAESTVPNLQPGNVGIQITSGTQSSNPWPFAITPALSGQPVISEIDPTSGPHNQYVTIKGANFGSYVMGSSQVLFGTVAGAFSFPIQCSNTFWQSSQIIVKVPNTLAAGVYPIKVVRSDGQSSGTKNFTVNTNAVQPGLCALIPDNGQVGSQVRLYGDNFGAGASSVNFYNNQSVTNFALPSYWNNTQIKTVVPNNTQSGPVKVVIGTNSSNGLNYSVGSCNRTSDCAAFGSTYKCCPRPGGNYCATSCDTVQQCTYGWRIVTQSAPITELGVDKQWPNCTDSCGNAEIGVRFNSPLLESTVLASNFSIRDITGGLPGTVVPITGLDWNRADNSVVLNYSGTLTLGSIYLVSVLPRVLDINTGLYTGLLNIYNDGFDDPYTWTFKVAHENCQFSSVEVRPANFTATYPNQSIGYSAAPSSDPGICGGQPLVCNNCSWTWSSTQTNIATIGSGAKSVTARSTNSTTILTGSTQISCLVSQPGTTPPPAGQGTLNINYTDYVGTLSITNWWPNCNGACAISQVRVDFNSPLSPSSISSNYFKIYQGSIASANLVSNGTVIPINGNRSVIVGHQDFALGQSYILWVSKDVASIYNATLGGADRELPFTIGTERECRISSVDVVPELDSIGYGYTAIRRGQRIQYSADTRASNATCINIPVDCINCSYSWRTPTLGVATISGNVARPYMTISPGANDGDSTLVHVDVVDQGPPIISVSGDDQLSVALNLGPAPTIFAYQPPQGSINQCLNAAISVTFSQVMNAQSLRDGIKVFDVTNAASPVAVSGSLSISSSAGRTTAVFNPNPFLQASRTYRVEVADTVVNLQDVNLAAPFAWTFGTGTEICRISYAEIKPGQEFITCASNNCPDDVNPGGLAGNQHEYHAYAYDVRGTLLSATGLDFSWHTKNISPNNLLNFVGGATADTLLATVVNKNGNEVLIVNIVDGNLADQINLGQVSVSANITIFLCENPWPSINAFPWAPATGYNYNFSTYYCQNSGVAGATILPSLNIPAPTNPTPSGVLQDGEFIFSVNPAITKQTGNLFGSLALAEPVANHKNNNQTWLKTLAKIFIPKAIGQEGIPTDTTPEAPANLTVVSATAAGVSLTWQDRSSGTHQERSYVVERKDVNSGNIVSTALRADSTSFIDTTVRADVNYTYRVGAVSSANAALIIWSETVAVSVTSDQTGIDIIGIRVMGNPDHLSVKDWYQKHAPNPNQSGNLIKVDGYEAMQVGNTIYMAATNLYGGLLYTNIYILAYNVGARSYTQEIVRQMLANFKFNINVLDGQSNLCRFDNVLSTQSCSSDFDCIRPTGTYTCDSRGLKLRRDIKRLGDMLSTKQLLDKYGLAHKACDNSGQISCLLDNQCPSGGHCVPYYPLLNAGTFVRGESNSKWPSWLQTFSSTLGQTLAVDPINQFNGCSGPGYTGHDPNTCWNESDLTFGCPNDSLLYYYRRNNVGNSYSLAANFEYDKQNWRGVTFQVNLVNASLPNGLQAPLSANLNSICSGTSGNPSNPRCGNGIVDSAAPYNEQCDGGFIDNQCNAPVYGLGTHNWWNEQRFGCNPPGTLSASGQLIECRWYTPPTPLTAEQCGGYCRDNRLEPNYERCEVVNGVATYNNITYSCGTGYTLTCPSDTCQPTCSLMGSEYPASACGDGVWTQGVEQCDSTAPSNANGLANYDCSKGGNVRCNPPGSIDITTGLSNACKVSCDVGVSYAGHCGNGTIEAFICNNNADKICTTDAECGSGTCVSVERCDYASYATPTPSQATGAGVPALNVAYTCSQNCDFAGQPFCGDRAVQANYSEICDGVLSTIPTPSQSSATNQYACSMLDNANVGSTRCTPTVGGYCGDGIVQNGQNQTVKAGEQCDPLGYAVTAAQPSSPTHQYVCNNSCQMTGGYCGDAIVEKEYGEQCEGGQVACSSIDSKYTSGVMTCNAATCQGGSTAGCCTINGLSAKFMVDNQFQLFVNGTLIGDGGGNGLQWEACGNGDLAYSPFDAGTIDDNGACEFRVDGNARPDVFNSSNQENVLAFTATDYGNAAGVIGTFSCQATTCKSICYLGPNAGDVCTADSDCGSDGQNGYYTCVHPGAGKEGASCNWNADCGRSSDFPKASLCLPDDFGITTKVAGGLWHCTETAPSGDAWKSPGFVENTSWNPAQAAVTTPWLGGWWQQDTADNGAYWNHMVPGAQPIWLGLAGTASGKTIYCRYVISNGSGTGPAPSPYSVTPSTLAVPNTGGTYSATVSGGSGWVATANATWITNLVKTSTGFSFTIPAQTNSGAERVGTVSVTGGSAITVTQAGGVCAAVNCDSYDTNETGCTTQCTATNHCCQPCYDPKFLNYRGCRSANQNSCTQAYTYCL